ncbi:OmpH family outer membrane protein [Limibacter armeniacum]|uniref:OmpH family outer membrane protein n=1 Tax=Limibacter armeniacum TaxID=466084 RepID=UPI002FE64476
MKTKFFIAFFIGLFATVLFSGVNNTYAQGKPFAYADIDSVVQALPEFETKMKELESYQKQLVTSMQTQQKDLEAKYADFQKNQPNWLPEIVRQKAQEIELLQKNLQEFQQTSQVNFSKRQQDALMPLQDKAMKGIEDVAKEMGYQYVIPSQMLLYSDGADDITGKVIQKLGGKQ